MNVVFWCLIFAECSLLIGNVHVQAVSGISTTIAPKCLRDDSKKCVIVSLSLSDPSHKLILPPLSGKSTLQIKRGNLTAFSEQLAGQLETVEKLQLGSLELERIFLKPELLELTAGGNRIDTVEFPSGDVQFKLQVLDLSENRLKDLAGFEALVNLRELHLEGNALKSVDFKVFKGMKILEKLFLDRNQITTVEASESFELPVLEYLSLTGNQIERLDVNNWQLDSLTKWDVSANKLVQIDGPLEERFPSLQMISVAKNEWHCKWLEDSLQRFKESFVMVQDRDEDCQGISLADICCVPEHTDLANDERLNESKKLENNQKDLKANIEREFGKLKDDYDSKLKSLESRLKMLEETTKDQKEKPAVVESNPNQDVQNIPSFLEEAREQWAKQKQDYEAAQRKLRFTLVELKRSLERDAKQIAELQAQVESLHHLDIILQIPCKYDCKSDTFEAKAWFVKKN